MAPKRVLREWAMAAWHASRLACASACLAVTASCNLLLGTAEPLGRHESLADDSGSEATADPDATAPPLDAGAGFGATADVAVDVTPDSGAIPVPCPESCPTGDCVLPACAVRVVDGLGRLETMFVDPGTTGSVFFDDYDARKVYHYDKATGALGSYSASSGPPVGVVANATTVFWGVSDHGIGWAPRSATTSAEVEDTSYKVTWNVPWGRGIDTDFMYWCDSRGADCWRIDFDLKTPVLLYREVAPDAGPPQELLLTAIAVDPGPDGFAFFIARDHLNRMNKDGTGFTVFAPVLNQWLVGLHGGYVYWIDPEGALVRAPEDAMPPCSAGTCGQVLLPAGTPYLSGPSAFDDTYVYWIWSSSNPAFIPSRIARARQDGASPTVEILAEHTGIASLGIDDTAIYYTTQTDDGKAGTGSLWRLAK